MEQRDFADKSDMKGCALPQVFEVRLTELTLSLLNAILTSWNTLVLYSWESEKKAIKGYYTLLTYTSVLELMAFIADVLTVFSRLQWDTVTLLDLDIQTSPVTSNQAKFKDTLLLDGWVVTLQTPMESTEEDDDAMHILKNITLSEDKSRLREHHLFVTSKRDNATIKKWVCSITD